MTSGRTLTLLVAPCGACASSHAILSCAVILRQKGILPRIPLDVALIGADLSVPAQKFSQSMLSQLTDWYASQGVFVTPTWITWDATDRQSNIILLEALHASPAPRNLLILTANFSRVLKDHHKYKAAMPQFQDLWESSATVRTRQSVAIWIEPQMNAVIAEGGTFSKIGKFAQSLPIIGSLFNSNTDKVANTADETPQATDEASMSFLYGVKSGKTRLAIMTLNIKRDQRR